MVQLSVTTGALNTGVKTNVLLTTYKPSNIGVKVGVVKCLQSRRTLSVKVATETNNKQGKARCSSLVATVNPLGRLVNLGVNKAIIYGVTKTMIMASTDRTNNSVFEA